MKLFTKLAAENNGVALCQLAQYYIFSYRAVKCDWNKAEELLSRAVAVGYSEATLWQGVLAAERADAWFTNPQELAGCSLLFQAAGDSFVTRAYVCMSKLRARQAGNTKTAADKQAADTEEARELEDLLLPELAAASDPFNATRSVHAAYMLGMCHMFALGTRQDKQAARKLLMSTGQVDHHMGAMRLALQLFGMGQFHHLEKEAAKSWQYPPSILDYANHYGKQDVLIDNGASVREFIPFHGLILFVSCRTSCWCQQSRDTRQPVSSSEPARRVIRVPVVCAMQSVIAKWEGA